MNEQERKERATKIIAWVLERYGVHFECDDILIDIDVSLEVDEPEHEKPELRIV